MTSVCDDLDEVATPSIEYSVLSRVSRRWSKGVKAGLTSLSSARNTTKSSRRDDVTSRDDRGAGVFVTGNDVSASKALVSRSEGRSSDWPGAMLRVMGAVDSTGSM